MKKQGQLKFINYSVEKFNFEQKGLQTDDDAEININIGLGNHSADKGHTFTTAIKAEISCEGVFKIETVISGNFEYSEDTSEKNLEVFKTSSSPAILLPYVRSFISTVTSQAGMKPVILPLMNLTKK